jgi:hypothetical protein
MVSDHLKLTELQPQICRTSPIAGNEDTEKWGITPPSFDARLKGRKVLQLKKNAEARVLNFETRRPETRVLSFETQVLNSETRVLNFPKTQVLNSVTQVLNSETRVLNSKTQVLNYETRILNFETRLRRDLMSEA